MPLSEHLRRNAAAIAQRSKQASLLRGLTRETSDDIHKGVLASSRPTCRGKTPWRRPGLSGHPHPRHRHRPVAGHRHLTHRRHDPRQTIVPPCWRRRATPRRRRRLAGKLARKPCVVRSPVPRLCQRHPGLGLALVVLVMAVPPDALVLIPSLGGAVEPLVHAP
jgi:hypothetical protein